MTMVDQQLVTVSIILFPNRSGIVTLGPGIAAFCGGRSSNSRQCFVTRLSLLRQPFALILDEASISPQS